MDATSQYKIINVLNKLLDPSIGQVISETHLNYLLSFLTGKEDDLGSIGSPRLEETMFLPWIKQAVDQWKINKLLMPTSIVKFVAELTAAMCINEQAFVKLNFTKILDEFINILRSVNDINGASQIKLSYIELISSFLNHTSGIQWLMVTNYWFDVFTMISPRNPEEICKKSCSFMVRLLEISMTDNEMFCCNIIDIISSPLNDLSLYYNESGIVENDCVVLALYPLTKIVEDLFTSNCQNQDSDALTFFKDKFNLERSLKNLIRIVKHPGINIELLKLFYVPLMLPTAIFLLSLDKELIDPQERRHDNQIADSLLEVIRHWGIKKGLEVIYRIHVLFQTIGKTIKNINEVNRIGSVCHTQLLIFIMYPVQFIAMNLVGKITKEPDEIRDQLSTKIFQSLVPVILKVYRTLTSLSMQFTTDDAILALKYLVTCSQFYSQSVAVIAIQLMIYVLLDVFEALKTKPEVISRLSQDFIVALLDTILTFLKNFDVNWRDSIEATYLTDVTSKFLDIYPWSPTVVVKALQLLDLGISKSLSPNMALLIDIADSDVDFGKLIYSKLCDTNCEVKDVAIQVVRTICQKVEQRFDTYKKLVIEADFPSTVLKISRIDYDVSVKISAVRCLQEMVKIKEFWNNLSENLNIYEQIFQIYRHPNGEVRKEILILLKEVYQRYQLSDQVLNNTYSIMKKAVIEDPDPSVKMSGLEFWHQVIERHLSNEGMIDGAFPSITFSKTSKKIITFDDREIRICLNRVVDQLTEIGCLQAFHFALHYDIDNKLGSRALTLLKNFLALLKKYMPIDNNTSVNSNTCSTTTSSICTTSMSTSLSISTDISSMDTSTDTSTDCRSNSCTIGTDSECDVESEFFSIDQLIKHSLMDSSILDASSYLDDFFENLLDEKKSENSFTNSADVQSTSVEIDDNFNKNGFLQMATDFDSFKNNDLKNRGQQNDDNIINYILNL